jgi:Family of unknown function (DUF6279)
MRDRGCRRVFPYRRALCSLRVVPTVAGDMRLRPSQHHPRNWRLFLGAPLLAMCALLTAGCSSSFFYNRLDTFAGWYFESLVSLNDGQRNELRAWLERTLAWHRSSELDRYAAFLNDVSASIAQPGTRQSYDAMRERFQGLIDDLIKKTAPEASQLLVRLSPKQVDELLENLEEKTRESTLETAEAVAENEWRPEQTKDIARQMKRWAGSVSAQQKAIIATHVEQLEPTHAEWAESQEAWREALREALSARDEVESDVAPPRVQSLLADPNRRWTSAYSQKVARNRERYQQMLIELDATLASQQREHLRTQLNKLSQQLTHLARG